MEAVQKCSKIKGENTKQHSSYLRKIGAYLQKILNLRNENLLSTPSMHMMSKKYWSDAEMDTLTKSCSPTIVISANGEVQTHEEATVYVKELDMFLTVKVLENTPAVLSLGKLCSEHGYSYEWVTCQKPHLTTDGSVITCETDNSVPIVVPGLSSSSSSSSSSTSKSKDQSNSIPVKSGTSSDPLMRETDADRP